MDILCHFRAWWTVAWGLLFEMDLLNWFMKRKSLLNQKWADSAEFVQCRTGRISTKGKEVGLRNAILNRFFFPSSQGTKETEERTGRWTAIAVATIPSLWRPADKIGEAGVLRREWGLHFGAKRGGAHGEERAAMKGRTRALPAGREDDGGELAMLGDEPIQSAMLKW